MTGIIEPFRLAVVATHPIQYQAPLWRALAQSGVVKLKVFYAGDHGVNERVDPLYGQAFAWDIPLLGGYDYEFVRSVEVPGLPKLSNRYPTGLCHRLKAGRYEAVLINGYMNAAAWAGYRTARKLNIPILLRGDSHLYGRRTSVSTAVKKPLLRRFLSGVSFCLAIGEWNRRYWKYFGMSSQQIRTTIMAIDNARFRVAASENRERSSQLRAEWGVGAGDTVFIFVGNFGHHKGIDVLVEAFLDLRRSRDAVHLVLIGAGPLDRELRSRTARTSAVHWPGFINQADLPVYLGAADVFVLPSRFEPWGLVVNEAMACGLPAIVSDAVGAGPDLISGPDAGQVVPAGDAAALVAAMERSCDPMMRGRWREKIAPILDRASFEHNVQTIVECLTELRGERVSGCVS